MTADPSKLLTEALAISTGAPAIRAFAGDAATNIQDLAVRVAKLEGAPSPAPAPTPAPSPAPTPAPGVTVVWDGSFRTAGSAVAPWHGVQQLAPGRFTVAPAPWDPAQLAAQFTVQPGDTLGTSSHGERCEVLLDQATTDGYDGHTFHWRFPLYLPATYKPNGSDWNIIAQFHNLEGSGQPNLYLATNGASLHLVVCNGTVAAPKAHPFPLGPWPVAQLFEVDLAGRWSSDPTVGHVAALLDGKAVLPNTAIQTLYPGSGVYLKQGLYRNPQQTTATVYSSGAQRLP